MKIFIGADHNGYQLKEQLESYLRQNSHEVIDVSGDSFDPADDYPLHAAKVANGVLAHNNSVGLLLCGSGQGVCMTANRFKGIRASLAWNESQARVSRNDDDANILCLPARELKNFDQARDIVDVWLKTPFENVERRRRRIKQMDEIT